MGWRSNLGQENIPVGSKEDVAVVETTLQTYMSQKDTFSTTKQTLNPKL